MALLKLSAPWETYYKELNELLKKDKEIHVIYDREYQSIDIYVENEAKAEALAELLPQSKHFGNVELTIAVIPANKCNRRCSKGSIYEDAFYNNPVVDNIVSIENIMSNPITYVIFHREIVQYYNDDLGDANGVCTTLYQDIAKRVLEDREGAFFCTNVISASFVSTSASPWVTTVASSN